MGTKQKKSEKIDFNPRSYANGLLPCPFCRGDVTLEKTIDLREWYGVVCRNTTNLGGTCALSIAPSASKDAAIKRWNMRDGKSV